MFFDPNAEDRVAELQALLEQACVELGVYDPNWAGRPSNSELAAWWQNHRRLQSALSKFRDAYMAQAAKREQENEELRRGLSVLCGIGVEEFGL